MPKEPGLPDPATADSPRQALSFQAANDSCEVVLLESRKRKRGSYGHYDDEIRAKIARYAIDCGVAKASRKFSNELERKVSETTVRSMRGMYIKIKKKEGSDVPALPHSPRGAPTMLGNLDHEVKDWVRRVRENGGVVNVRTVMGGAEAIVTKHARNKLQRYGGPIVITKHLARFLLRRMGYVKRKGTKSVKKLPEDFETIRNNYVQKVNGVISDHNIPEELVINWDQTGCQMVPGGDWTMEEQGSKQVSISGLDDKRQITVLLSITKSGNMLPPQLIYAGKTDRCLPKGVSFPRVECNLHR